MKKVVIITGHSSVAPGATAVNGVSEYTWNSDLVNRIEKILKANANINVVRLERPLPNDTVSLVKNVNKEKTDLAVEFHFNSYNKVASGTEILCWKGSKNGERAANLLKEATVECLGLADRGIKYISKGERGAYFLEKTNCPSVLTEPFFGDNASDFKIADAKKQELAEAQAKAIINYLA